VADVDRRHRDALEEAGREDLHVAREHEQVDAVLEKLEELVLRLGLPLRLDEDVLVRQAKARRSGSSSGWFETTRTTSASSSSRRQRQSRWSRQWSYCETRMSIRLRSSAWWMLQSIPKGHAISSSNRFSRSRCARRCRRSGTPSAGRRFRLPDRWSAEPSRGCGAALGAESRHSRNDAWLVTAAE
jgi:hypothetical protein